MFGPLGTVVSVICPWIVVSPQVPLKHEAGGERVRNGETIEYDTAYCEPVRTTFVPGDHWMDAVEELPETDPVITAFASVPVRGSGVV